MALPLRARGGGGASLFPLRRPGLETQGLLRGTQPAVRAGQEFSGADAGRVALYFAGPVLVARAIPGRRTRRGGAVPAGGRVSLAHALLRAEGACRADAARARLVAQTARDPPRRAPHARHLPLAAAYAFDPGAACGGALTMPAKLLLVIVPAYNEEAAVGGVVRSIQTALPDTPVLVIDDCSIDATHAVARAAGARVLALPHHLGLGGCVQAGYKLAFELGYEYVIRVDGDGQHDANDIPRMFEALRTTGCEMVIGSRFVEANGARTSAVRS